MIDLFILFFTFNLLFEIRLSFSITWKCEFFQFQVTICSFVEILNGSEVILLLLHSHSLLLFLPALADLWLSYWIAHLGPIPTFLLEGNVFCANGRILLINWQKESNKNLTWSDLSLVFNVMRALVFLKHKIIPVPYWRKSLVCLKSDTVSGSNP